MIVVYLRKNGMQGSYGEAEDLDEAISLARQEFKEIWGVKPKAWSVKMHGVVLDGKFTTYKSIEKKAKKYFNIP